MDHRWSGPYSIVKDVGKGFYSIQNVDNGKKHAWIHGMHLKPYNTPSETPKPADKQDSSNESHQDQGHDSSHNSHLSDDSSSASSTSKVNTEAIVIKAGKNEDDHTSHIKSPSHQRSISQLQESSPQAYDPAEFSNNECDNAFLLQIYMTALITQNFRLDYSIQIMTTSCKH